MRQFKSLLKRDIYLNKGSLLLPVLGVAICYLFLIFIHLKWGLDLGNLNYQMKGANMPFVGLIGVIIGNIMLCGSLLFITVLGFMTPNALNDNIKNHCEIFYKCLPIPPWKVVISKVVSTIITPVVIVLGLVLLNTWIAFLILGDTSEISLGVLIRFTLSILLFSFPYLLLFGSFFIFLSGILKKSVVAKFLGITIGINILINIFRSVSGVKISTLSEYVSIWLANPSFTGKKIIDVELVGKGFMDNMTLNTGIDEVSSLIASSIFSWDGLCLIIATAILLTSSVYAYKFRKLD